MHLEHVAIECDIDCPEHGREHVSATLRFNHLVRPPFPILGLRRERYSLADMGIDIGATGTATLIVDATDTAIALGSGDVPVLATPRIVALLEQAAVAAIASSLGTDATSVGTHVAVDHLAASFLGASIEAVAEIVDVDGRSVSYRLVATEGDRTIATGNHTRIVVDRERFLGTR